MKKTWLILFVIHQVAALNRKALDEIIQADSAHIGIKVVSLKTQTCLYEHNADKLFLPASTMKLCTAVASLLLLGPNFTFDTTLGIQGNMRDSFLQGNVYIKASGDPLFSYQDLERCIKALSEKGIKHIEGSFVIDISEFDQVPFAPGWSWDDGPAVYHSPISAINVEHNCIQVTLKPQQKGQPTVKLYPSTDFVTINNRATVGPEQLLRDL